MVVFRFVIVLTTNIFNFISPGYNKLAKVGRGIFASAIGNLLNGCI